MDALAVSTEDLACPICMERLKDPFVTPCGHSFCYTCIATHLQHRSVCPSCAAYLTIDSVFPNYLLSKVANKVAAAEVKRKGTLLEQLKEAIHSDEHLLKLTDLDLLLEALEEKRNDLQQREKENSLELLLHFLNHSRESKTRKLQELHEELQILNKDISHVEFRQSSLPASASPLPLPGIEHQASWRGAESQPYASDLNSSRRRSLLLAPRADESEEAAQRGAQSLDLGNAPLPGTLLGPAARPPLPGGPLIRENGPSWGVSGLFHTNGQHLSNSALGMDIDTISMLQNAPPASGGVIPGLTRSPQEEDQEAAEDLPMASEDASVPQSTTAGPTESPIPVSLSSDARQPSGSLLHSSTPQGTTGNSRDAVMAPPQLPNSHDSALQSDQGRRMERPHASPSQPMPLSTGMGRRASDEQSSEPTSQGTWTSSRTLSNSEAGEGINPATRARKRRFEAQFEDLQQHYLRMRQRQLVGARRSSSLDAGDRGAPANHPAVASAASRGHVAEPSGEETTQASEAHAAASAEASRRDPEARLGPVEPDDLHEFSRMLSMFTHSWKLKVIAAIPGASQRASAAIISSIAFDAEARHFATAGVSKRISIFNFQEVVDSAADSSERQASHAPKLELVSRSKLSCLSWNSQKTSELISSDYEGVVALWDAHAGQPLSEYEAHDKRIWSVDYCPSDRNVFASGSDDCFVKVWSTTQNRSLAEIDMKANVCCVQYHPEKGHELAVGSADHQVHLFDLRNASRPVFVFPGHKKAVSYVRFFGNNELVSASTDSSLRSWNTLDFEPVRTYSGHVNEKNFVGLSLSGMFIACGSETSEVFVYYRSMSKPVARRVFSPPITPTSSSGGSRHPRQNLQFISSLAWKPDSQTLVAANSQGAIKAMQLSA